MHWQSSTTPRATPSHGYTVRARSREAARRKLAAAIQVPLWTVR